VSGHRAEVEPLTTDQADQVEAHLPLVWTVIKLIGVPPDARDDAFQDGCLGLIAAVRLYKPGSITFGSYAFSKIRHTIIDELRNRTQHRRKWATPVLIELGAIEDTVPDSHRPDDDRAAGQDDARRRLKQIVDLTESDERDRTIVAVLAAGGTLAEAGRVLGITESAVCHRRNALREKVA
jgi:RNA polymerase sigma factor (sigma-70 family)